MIETIENLSFIRSYLNSKNLKETSLLCVTVDSV